MTGETCACPMNADTGQLGRAPSCPLHGYTSDAPASSSAGAVPAGRGDTDELREQIATEAASHGISIGVDQRLVLCTCGWRDHSEENLSRPLGKWKLHVADALLPVVLAYGERRAAEELEGWVRSFRAVATAAIRRENRKVYPRVAAVLEAGARDLRRALAPENARPE